MTTDGAPQLDTSAADVASASSATDSAPATGEGSERDPSSWESEIKQLRAEAKRHRLAQRAAESERDQLRTRVDQHDREHVERIVGDRLQNPSDLWLTTDLSSLRDEEGAIDADKLSEHVEQLTADKPHWRKSTPADFSSGARQPIKRPASIGEAFKRSLHAR